MHGFFVHRGNDEFPQEGGDKWGGKVYPQKIHTQRTGNVEKFCMEIASNNQVAQYASTPTNVLNVWSYLLDFAIVFSLLSLFFLSKIDKDKR